MSIRARHNNGAKKQRELRESFPFNDQAAFVASQTGTEFKAFGVADFGYDYREVNRKPEIGGAYGNIALNVEKHPDGGYVNTYR